MFMSICPSTLIPVPLMELPCLTRLQPNMQTKRQPPSVEKANLGRSSLSRLSISSGFRLPIMNTMLAPTCPMRLAKRTIFHQATTPGQIFRPTVLLRASKGFGTETPAKSESQDDASQPQAGDYAIEALEARMRSRRAKRVEPKVKVESAAVDAVQGKTEMTAQQQAEGGYVFGMVFLFGIVILEGLVIAGSGFLPEDWDVFVQESLYPNYTWTMLLFLGASSLYGLWKVGKISLPGLGQAPPQPPE